MFYYSLFYCYYTFDLSAIIFCYISKTENRGTPTRRGRLITNRIEGKEWIHLIHHNYVSCNAGKLGVQELSNENISPDQYLGTKSNIYNYCHALSLSNNAIRESFISWCHKNLISLANPTLNGQLNDMTINSLYFSKTLENIIFQSCFLK